MVLYFIWSYCTVSHCYIPLLQRAGELPRSASSHFFTQEARVWAGAYDQVVSFASPDVLQGKDAPVPVLVARPDRLDLLAGLGQGEHLAAGLVRCQPRGVAVGGEGGGRAGVAGFRAGTKWNGEVESEVDCIAHLLRSAVWKLEEMLVVREVVIQRSILLRGHVLCCGNAEEQ